MDLGVDLGVDFDEDEGDLKVTLLRVGLLFNARCLARRATFRNTSSSVSSESTSDIAATSSSESDADSSTSGTDISLFSSPLPLSSALVDGGE